MDCKNTDFDLVLCNLLVAYNLTDLETKILCVIRSERKCKRQRSHSAARALTPQPLVLCL